MTPIPVHAFTPETDTSYLVFCPEHGGWHVGEWWVIDGPARWALAYDANIELAVSHVLPVPPDAAYMMHWAWSRQGAVGGNA